MICQHCGTNTVTWRGPLVALTHTECSSCGGRNCQVVEIDEDDDQGVDSALQCSPIVGTPVTATVRLRRGPGYVVKPECEKVDGMRLLLRFGGEWETGLYAGERRFDLLDDPIPGVFSFAEGDLFDLQMGDVR